MPNVRSIQPRNFILTSPAISFNSFMDIGSLRLGNLLIVGIPGEIAAQLGMSIKLQVRQIIGIQHVVIGGLANEWVSYILSAEEYKKGGYEASVSFYGETLGQVIVEGALEGVSKISNVTKNFL